MGDRSGILIHRRTGLAASLLLTACCLLGQAVAAQRHVTSGPCCLVGQVVIDEGHSWSDVSPDVESIHIDNPTPSDAAALPKHAKLNEVTIRCGTNEDDSGDSADTIKVVQALADLPELRTVSVWWCSGKQPLFEALARLKTVTRIDVSGCFELDPLALEMLAKSEKLTYLSLSTINNFGDAHIKAIAKLENLEQLSIETDGVWNTIDKSTRRRKLGRKPADALLPLVHSGT